MSADESGSRGRGPSDLDLANYARAYVGAYMGAVKSESPQHLPAFYKNQPYSIEVCYMPNESFCLLFEKSERPAIAVTSQDWDYVMSKVMSGVSYLATVYPHEGCTVDDATAKGRRDAIRDIRAYESSEMVDATRQLEKAIGELTNMNEWTKNPIKMAETVISRLEPVRRALQRGGPTVDMMTMVDGVRRYSAPEGTIDIRPEDIATLGAASKTMADLSTMLRDVKLQGEKLEDVEEHLRGELHDFKIELDKKIAKGLGVILATTDRKIDKAIASVQPSPGGEDDSADWESLSEDVEALKEAVEQLQAAEGDDPSGVELHHRLAELAEEVGGLRSLVENLRMPEMPVMPEPKVPEELLASFEAMRGDLGKVSLRVKRIEDYLAAISTARRRRG